MKKYAYWLANVKGIGAGKLHYLIENGLTAYDIFGMSHEKLCSLEELARKDADAIEESKRGWNIDENWIRLMEQGIGFVSIENENYPTRLKHITNAPYCLYYIGKLPKEEEKSIAIVGARGRSAYGSEVTRKLAKELSNSGVQVISGLAKGIDADAHSGALEGSTPTYAVLGCGVDVCYPASNRYLYESVLERGGILSEYPPKTQPCKSLFPARNRIISGLSDCVVIMEARERSGSLITADFAMEQGRDVYALPGRITDPLSAGCNHLIRQGAGIVQSVEDFLEELDILPNGTEVQMDFWKKLLEKDERLVYSVTDFRPMGLGNLLEKTEISLERLLKIINRLESLGLIKEIFPNHYIRTVLR